MSPLIHPVLPILPAERAPTLEPVTAPVNGTPTAPALTPEPVQVDEPAAAPEWFDAPAVAVPGPAPAPGTAQAPFVHPVAPTGLRITRASPATAGEPAAVLAAGSGRWLVLLAVAGALLVRRRRV